MIVDVHSHYGQWVSSAAADTPESFVSALDRFDIAATIVSSARAVEYEIVSGNAEVAGLLAADPRIYAAVTVNPNHYESSVSQLEMYGPDDRFLAAKLHPDYCGVPADAPQSMRLISRAAKIGLPLFVHTWGPAEVESTVAVARAFPDLPVFAFHMGGSAWRQAIARARELPNLYLEIVSTIPEAWRIREAVEAVGADRVFFGTDMTLFTPAYALGLVDSAGLSPADKEKILGLNAGRFFGIPSSSERKSK